MRKGHTYGVAVADLDTGHVLDIAAGRKKEAVEKVLKITAPDAEVAVSDAATVLKGTDEQSAKRRIDDWLLRIRLETGQAN